MPNTPVDRSPVAVSGQEARRLHFHRLDDMSRFAALPEEILLQIIAWLEPPDIVTLQAVSRHFLSLCRDDSTWRTLALSSAVWTKHRQLAGRPVTPPAENDYNDPQDESSADQWFSSKYRARAIANWDTTFPGETPRWYDEYIHRHAPVVVNWLQQPLTDKNAAGAVSIDVRGLALYRPTTGDYPALAVSPLEDGTVCLWDVKGTKSRLGAVHARSRSGLLWEHVPPNSYPRRSTVTDPGILESVAVDDYRGIAFFAIGHVLIEVDLAAMKVVSEKMYDFSINSLSAIQKGLPLTVGTTLGLHLNDHRTPSHTLSPYASLPQPGPISIAHLEKAGSPGQISDDILVAGRFSNILHYDRRQFPKIKGSIYSGAKLCSMVSLPYPFPIISSTQRRNLALTEEQVDEAKHESGRTLVACGEYKSKGSLEIYGLSSSSLDLCSAAYNHAPIKNRVTAASAKVLYVANHGNRIVYSDGQGYLKWVERDGMSEVRRHKIGQSERASQSSLFRTMPGSDDIAMKLISTKTATAHGSEDSSANNDDILFWTGDKLGLARFSSTKPFFAEDFLEKSEFDPTTDAEVLYSERMRLALERQAQDVHFVRELGAGGL